MCQEMSKHSSGKGSMEQTVTTKQLNRTSLPSNASCTAKAVGQQKPRENTQVQGEQITERKYPGPKEQQEMYARNAKADLVTLVFLRPSRMMFYKSRLFASLESQEASSEDEPTNGQGG